VTDEGSFLLDEEVGEVCGWCHGGLLRGGRGKELNSVHGPIEQGKCLSCHDAHLSPVQALLKDDAPACRECHEETFRRLEEERYVHGPLNLGDCRLCHTVHSSAEPSLLVEPATSLCVQCHSEIAVSEGTPEELMPHTMIPEGKCGTCHQPHSSNHPRMMREAASRICYGCHPENTKSFHEKKGFSIYVCQKCHDLHRPKQEHLIVDNSRFLCLECHEFRTDAAFTHEFIREGGCFSCHSYHAAPLSDDIASLCLKCHGAVLEKAGAHGGIPVGESQCTSCHRPHQSNKKSLLYASEHTPFAKRDCAACHEDPSAPLSGAVRGLCVECHDDKDLAAAESAGDNIHPPFGEEDCRFCHSSHTSGEDAMLVDRRLEVCLQCHGDFRRITVLRPRSAHGAVLAGECGECHDPHTSPNKAFLHSGVRTICLGCHEDLLAGADGEGWTVPHEPVAEGKCRLCHNHHSSRRESLLKSPMPRGCRPCHTEFFSRLKNIGSNKTHTPVRKGECAACHDVHGSDSAAFVDVDAGEKTCLSCHDRTGGVHHSYSSEEIAAKAGGGRANFCLYCHKPHASSNRGLLFDNRTKVCVNCHKL
jgi:predicted CXXCH cytochrome family protein